MRKMTQELWAEAIAAGDGTLHGAIDYWQGRCSQQQEALRLASEALLNCESALDEARGYPVTVDLVIEALAAIDEVLGGV